MRRSPTLTTVCCLITLLSIFQPVDQKSAETPGRVGSLPQSTRTPGRVSISPQNTRLPVRAGTSPQNTRTTGRGGTSPQNTRIRKEADDGPLVFIDETPKGSKQVVNRGGLNGLELNPTPCPNGLSYCNSADDYPKDYIKNLLKKQPKTLLGHFYVEEDNVDANRFSPDDPYESPLCITSRNVIYPNKVESKEGFYEFVINDDEHRQGVLIETCRNNGKECTIPGSLSLGYTSRCVQKKLVRTMVVLNRNSSDFEGFVTKPFEFPSCCSCIVTMTADRFGGSGVDRFGGRPAITTSPAVSRRSKPKKNRMQCHK